jgi:hypothetical protein
MKLLSLLFLTFAGGTTGLQQLCAEKVAADINGDQSVAFMNQERLLNLI